MYSTVAVAVAMCLLLPISIDAEIVLSVSPRKSGMENNVKLECKISATATFYRNDSADSVEELSDATVTDYHREGNVVTFVLNGTTEGSYFCISGGEESSKKELVAYPPHLPNPSSSLIATWNSSFKVDCPYKIGVLREQYDMEWTVVGPTSAQLVNSNTNDYQLVGSSLIMSSFTPFIERLICTLKVKQTEDFRFLSVGETETRSFTFRPITIESGNNGQTNIIQAPSDTRANGSTAEFKCAASVPQNRIVTFEMFGETVSTNDSSCTTAGPSFTRRTCIKRNVHGNINNPSMELNCNYSTGYQISCLLRVDNLKDSDLSDVTCRILKGSTIEASRTAKLLSGMNTQHSLSCSPPCITLPKQGYCVVQEYPNLL